jgi:hypothetical protein
MVLRFFFVKLYHKNGPWLFTIMRKLLAILVCMATGWPLLIQRGRTGAEAEAVEVAEVEATATQRVTGAEWVTESVLVSATATLTALFQTMVLAR